MSARQVGVALFTGLLSPAAMVAGLDWRGGLLAVPVVLVASWCWSRLDGWPERGRGWCGKILTFIYIMWMVGFAGAVLAESAGRITAPEERGIAWVVLLLCLVAFWLAKIKPTAFGRAAEIFYLVMGATLVFVLAFGGVKIRLERLLEGTGEIWRAFVTAAGVGCSGVVAVLLWDRDVKGDRRSWVRWSGAFAVVLVLMGSVTVGVLSPSLAAVLERPFFLMTVGLGQTARVEGLVSAIWILADLTLVGVLLQSGCQMWSGLGRKRGAPWVLILATLGVALFLAGKSSGEIWGGGVLPLCGLIFGGAIPAVACLCAKWRKPKK